ncbi:MAG TPA: DUF1295 domain-containing protein [Rhodanobacteraceae bacterium]
MNAFAAILTTWAIAALAQTAGFAWQRARRNAGIVDAIWATTVGIGAVVIAAFGDGALLPRVTVAVLGGAWGFRLASHLAARVFGEEEDGRYAHLRSLWKQSDVKWFAFFQAQALLAVIFAVPFLGAARNPNGDIGPAWIVAVLWWLASVAGESIADRQLARWRADPANRGKACRAGLWRYSRHPNYFFEWLHWFAYVWLAIGSPWFAVSFAGPVVMYVFLRWISGIPYTEAQALRRRGEDYREYQRTTPMLIPWFPRKSP